MAFCTHCEKSKQTIDMHDNEMCDDCFDLAMELELESHNIHDEQKGKCYKCGCELSGWIVEAGKAVCWPSCNNQYPKAIRLIAK